VDTSCHFLQEEELEKLRRLFRRFLVTCCTLRSTFRSSYPYPCCTLRETCERVKTNGSHLETNGYTALTRRNVRVRVRVNKYLLAC
jgi:hypothetical protein